MMALAPASRRAPPIISGGGMPIINPVLDFLLYSGYSTEKAALQIDSKDKVWENGIIKDTIIVMEENLFMVELKKS